MCLPVSWVGFFHRRQFTYGTWLSRHRWLPVVWRGDIPCRVDGVSFHHIRGRFFHQISWDRQRHISQPDIGSNRVICSATSVVIHGDILRTTSSLGRQGSRARARISIVISSSYCGYRANIWVVRRTGGAQVARGVIGIVFTAHFLHYAVASAWNVRRAVSRLNCAGGDGDNARGKGIARQAASGTNRAIASSLTS